jgi:hypothetical protein
VTAAGGDDDTAAVAQHLVRRAGGYLRNPIRETGVTCAVCTTPVDGFDRCFVCQSAYGATPGLADLVIPLTYGIQAAQSGVSAARIQGQFRCTCAPSAGACDQLAAVSGDLGARGLHWPACGCCGRLPVGGAVRSRTPRRSSLRNDYPTDERNRGIPRLAVSQVDTGQRVVSADRFTLDPEADLAGKHVLILDDTWTTGANAQSAVLAARGAGAAAVSVMVVGRWLRPHFGHNAQFIKTRLARDCDPWICAVTGGECP